MLYSLSAMTSYGHANIFLAEDWQLMGAIEAQRYDPVHPVDGVPIRRASGTLAREGESIEEIEARWRGSGTSGSGSGRSSGSSSPALSSGGSSKAALAGNNKGLSASRLGYAGYRSSRRARIDALA